MKTVRDLFQRLLASRVPVVRGHETPQRVLDVKARYGLPVMKALSVREAADLDAIGHFSWHCG